MGVYLPGFPPIPGHKSTGAEHGFVAALVAADKLTGADAAELADEQNDEEEVCWSYNLRPILSFRSAQKRATSVSIYRPSPQFRKSRRSPQPMLPEQFKAGTPRLHLTGPLTRDSSRRQVRPLTTRVSFGFSYIPLM